jgi:acetyl-CoA carboxylase carboxyltransferase component
MTRDPSPAADPAAGSPATTGAPAAEPAAVADLRSRRDKIRTEMGGLGRVEALHASGLSTVRDRIGRLLDPGTFTEIGTFSESARPEDKGSTPGDGKVGGHGLIGGQMVTVAGDDVTVKRGSSSLVGSRKLHRLFDQALAGGNPLVYLGETGGARIPDTIGAVGHTSLNSFPDYTLRQRRIPLVTVIVGPSFGGSSLISAMSDFVVQIRGTCLSVTSPRVIEIATGEQATMEEIGGVDVHLKITGQIDVAADDEEQAFAYVRRFLGYLPPNAWTRPPRSAPRPPQDGPDLAGVVPERRSRAYDMHQVVRRLVDGSEYLELKPRYGRSVITALARIDGHPVGIVASQPMFEAGSVGPEACEKLCQFLPLCDSYGIPLLFLHDTPGFLVGKQVEHRGILQKAIRLQEALVLASVPKISVVIRKSFGLAHQVLNGSNMGADYILAWPGAEIGFMDPKVGANVIHYPELAALDPAERAEVLTKRASEVAAGTSPYDAAGVLNIDEVIEPGETRQRIAARLAQLQGREPRPLSSRLLATWPTC